MHNMISMMITVFMTHGLHGSTEGLGRHQTGINTVFITIGCSLLAQVLKTEGSLSRIHVQSSKSLSSVG